ncbi:MAG: GGDEF domain-containing protein, partial [Candidatus Limnocylindrales bacterium]
AGDSALRVVAERIGEILPSGCIVGRYGPDEFLLIAAPSTVADLEPVVHRLRTALVDLSLRFAETERLPVTVSVGIATYPEHATSVTGLLAVVVGVLE